MKRYISLLLAGALTLSLGGCVSSPAAQVQKQITDLGEITLESGRDIAAAEKALAALSEQDMAQVSAGPVLSHARQTYDALCLQQQADQIDARILSLGEVTLQNTDAVFEIMDSYHFALPQVKAQVENANLLTQSYEKARILIVEDLIERIGTVTKDSQDAIVAARDAYEALPSNLRTRVKNHMVLTSAVAAFHEAKQERLRELLQHMDKDYNIKPGVVFYYPDYISLNHNPPDEETYILPYLTDNVRVHHLNLVFNYWGSQPIGLTGAVIHAGDQEIQLDFTGKRISSRKFPPYFFENATYKGTDELIGQLRSIPDAETVTVHLAGTKGSYDFTMTERDREAFRAALEAYDLYEAPVFSQED